MEKTYIWFAIKVNVLLFIITAVVGMLSGLFLFPLELIFMFTSSELLKFIIITIWTCIVTIIPSYFAFKFLYKGISVTQNLSLVEAIIYVIVFQIVIDLVYLNFSQKVVETFPTIFSLLVNALISFGAFYFAGINCRQPVRVENEKINDNNQSPPPPPSYFNPQI